MNKTRSYLIIIAITVLTAFVVYTIWLIAKPHPLEVQGEVDATHIKISSKLIGRIDSLAVSKGQDVKAGDLLFCISSPEVRAKLDQAMAARKAAAAQRDKVDKGARVEDIQAAYNNWKKAGAASDLATKTFNRVNNLFKDGAVAAQKRDEAETQMKAAIETEQAAKALYDKAVNGAQSEDKVAAGALVDQVNGVIEEVNSYLNETQIKAPINGEVANIITEKGELVPAGYPVITLVDLSDVWVTFNLREDLLASVQKGTEFEAKFPALGNKKITLRVTYINVLGDYATWNATKTSGDFDMKTFEVQARPVEKTEGLRPGMTALVNWNTVSKKSKEK
jgi:HlyD family secretion protein